MLGGYMNSQTAVGNPIAKLSLKELNTTEVALT
jgi:hypothetical protein